jgi:2-polyprenyl-6-methoxyphenol hydroxylase-like FAD-dependent oxidoreductase
MAPHYEYDIESSISDGPSVVDIPVLIVGGGPTGLLLAHMLSQLGGMYLSFFFGPFWFCSPPLLIKSISVKSILIERYSQRLDAPKAHALSPRSLELCRQFGIDVNVIRKLGPKRDDAYWVNFVTNLSGIHVGSLPYERMDAEVLVDTPTVWRISRQKIKICPNVTNLGRWSTTFHSQHLKT